MKKKWQKMWEMLVSHRCSKRQEVSPVTMKGPIPSVKASQFGRHVDRYKSQPEKGRVSRGSGHLHEGLSLPQVSQSDQQSC